MTKKTKKTISIVSNVIITIFLVFAVAITVYATIVSSSGDEAPGIGNKAIIAIETNSMHGEKGFDEGSLIISQKLSIEQKSKLKEGDVITFKTMINGKDALNTHRIHHVEEQNGHVYYITWGDNNGGKIDELKVHYSNVVAIWQSEDFEGKPLQGAKINGLGSFLIFMTSQLGFLLLIILPLAIFFVFEIINLVKVVKQIRGKKTITAKDEEEIKRKAIEEYLKNQNAENAEKVEENSAVKGEK